LIPFDFFFFFFYVFRTNRFSHRLSS
jgi:hypothetical protein